MQRWNLRILAVAIGWTALATTVRADEPAPLPKPAKAPIADAELYRAATPYNPTFVDRPLPNPAYDRPNFTLPCENPHQDFSPLVLERPECIKRIFGRSECGCGGCGANNGYGGHAKAGGLSQGSCATCSNTYNFVWASSRSYFGESSREFFERPPAVDGIRPKCNPTPVIYRTGYRNP